VSQLRYKRTKLAIKRLVEADYGLTDILVIGRVFNNANALFEPFIFRSAPLSDRSLTGEIPSLESVVFGSSSIAECASLLKSNCTQYNAAWTERFKKDIRIEDVSNMLGEPTMVLPSGKLFRAEAPHVAESGDSDGLSP
jgi:hypothetical protein